MNTYPQIQERTQEPAAPAKPPTTGVVQRRSKAEALRIAGRMKRGAAIIAMLGFSAFGVTVGSHLATTSHTTTSTHTTTTSSGSSTSSSTSSSSNGGYFSQSSSGSSFGSSSSSSSPVTGTSTS